MEVRCKKCDARDEEVRRLTNLLKEVQKHCLCSRNTVGFDYGETHPKLGKPRAGSRWLAPVDLINTRMNFFKEEHESGVAGG